MAGDIAYFFDILSHSVG